MAGFLQVVGEIVSNAKSLYASLSGYVKDIKDAPERSRELRREIGAIADIIDDLHDVISAKSDFAPSAALREMILDFSTMVNQMNEEVQLSRTKGVHRLMWPFSKDENERLLNRISRYKDTFNLTLNLQNASAFSSSQWTNLCSLNSEKIQEDTKKIRMDTERLRDDTRKIMGDTERIYSHVQTDRRDKIRNWIFSEDFNVRHTELQKTRLENTGQWFLDSEEFKSFVNGKYSCLLCEGVGSFLFPFHC